MSLSDYIESVDRSNDADAALVDRILEGARRGWEDLANTIELCAIPPRFDAEIIGVLRGAPQDVDTNVQLLSQLLQYPFVQPRETGGVGYHDSVRSVLLARWQSDERRAALTEYTWRLVEHHRQQHAEAGHAEQHATRIRRLLQDASVERYRQIAAILEARVLAPLLEALSELAILGVATMTEFLREYLEAYDDRGRYSTARQLVAAARDLVTSRPDDEEFDGTLAWLQYWDGILLIRMGRPSEAETYLAALAVSSDVDDRLRFAALSELAQAQMAQYKMGDARETLQRAMELDAEQQDDPHNLPFLLMQLGRLERVLARPAASALIYGQAVEAANGLQDAWTRFWALLGSAEAELDSGHRSIAFERAMTGFDLARTELRSRLFPSAAMSEFFAGFFAGSDPALLDTLCAEIDALIPDFDDAATFTSRVDRARLLRRSGRFRRARAELGPLMEDQANAPLSQRAALLYQQASLEVAVGYFDHASEHLAATADAATTSGVAYLVAAARQDRGLLLAELGRWSEADKELVAAEQWWRDHGNTAVSALATAGRTLYAAYLLGVAEADRLLGVAEGDTAESTIEVRQMFLTAKARYQSATGRLGQAEESWRQALELSEMAQDAPERARCAAAHAHVITMQGKWDAAREAAQLSAGAAEAIATTDSYVPSDLRRAADEDNAQGVRSLVGEDPTTVTDALERLRMASERIDEPWYLLNLSYAAAAYSDFDYAVDSLERALAAGPWLVCSALVQRVASHHVGRGEALVEAGDHRAALSAFSGSLVQLSRPEQAWARARCLVGRGDSLRALGDLEGASSAYREAAAAGEPRAALELGQLLSADGDQMEALDAYRSAIGGEASIAVAAADGMLELLHGAAASERNAVVDMVRTRTGLEATIDLGNRLREQGQVDLAIYAYQTGEAASDEAKLRLAELLRAQGALDEARARYARAAESGDAAIASSAAGQLSEVLYEGGDVSGAIDVLRGVLARISDQADPELILRLSDLLVAARDPQAAENALRGLVEAPGTAATSWALLRLGDLRAGSGDEQGAIELYENVLAWGETESSAWAGLRLIDSGQAGDFERRIGLALSAGARSALRICELLLEKQQRPTAKLVLRQAADLPDDLYAPDAALLLGRLCLEDGEVSQAEEFLTRACESDDATVSPEAAIELVYRLGAPPAGTLDRVVALGGYAALRLGQLLAARGERDAALRALEAATESEVFAADARRALASLQPTHGHADTQADTTT